MSCACENRRLGSEIDRIRRIAKAWAVMEDCIVGLYKRDDGTYHFTPMPSEIDKPIIEYITPY